MTQPRREITWKLKLPACRRDNQCDKWADWSQSQQTNCWSRADNHVPVVWTISISTQLSSQCGNIEWVKLKWNCTFSLFSIPSDACRVCSHHNMFNSLRDFCSRREAGETKQDLYPGGVYNWRCNLNKPAAFFTIRLFWEHMRFISLKLTVKIPVSETICPPDRCGTSRCWLCRLIGAQVRLRPVTISDVHKGGLVAQLLENVR